MQFRKKFYGRQAMNAPLFKLTKIAIYHFIFAATFFAQNANAICIIVPNLRVTDFTLDVGTIVVPVDAKIGDTLTPIFRRSIVPPTGIISRCQGTGFLHYLVRLGTPVPGFGGVYTTNIPGIGYRLKYDFGGNTDPIKERALPFSTAYASNSNVIFGNPQIFILEFIVTSNISQGGILFSGNAMDITDDQGGVAMRAFFGANATKFILPSCRVGGGQDPIQVPFGKVPQSNFKGRGSVTAERNFSITLNCRAGVGVQSTVYLRMDATKDAATGDDGVLQITQSGAGIATGVGIQIVDGNSKTPVKFGDEALVGPSKDGDYVLRYTARYYQTGAKVTPGKANGTATFTIAYK